MIEILSEAREAADTPDFHYIDLFRLEREGGTDAERAKHIAIYVADECARAILAERERQKERDAKVAEGFSRMMDKPEIIDTAKMIAQAIRSGT